AVSADGKTLASATAHPSQPTITLWDLATRKPLGTLAGTSRALCLTFSAAGETLAAVHEDGSVKWWDVRSRQPCGALTLPGVAAPVRSAAYSPMSRVLATSDIQGKLWLYEMHLTRRPTGQPAAPVHALAQVPSLYAPTPSWSMQSLAF